MHESRKATYSRRDTRNDRVENRIQKLLVSEYYEFFDMVLVESPFAETTRNGRGIREVSLGLTPSKLIVAADVLKNNPDFFCPRGLDPSIESFELITVYPLEYVTLSVFSRRRRKTLKARFIDGRANYYELGGMQRKNVFWKIWCEQVDNLLAKKIGGSSLSESTAASSSSSTTVYILSSEIEVHKCNEKQGNKTVCRVWAHYGGAGDYATPTWTNKDLYLGRSHNDLTNDHYTPVPVRFAGASFQDVRDELKDHSQGILKKPCQSWPTCRILKDRKRNSNANDLCDVLFMKDHDQKYCRSSPCNNYQDRSYDHEKLMERRKLWYKEERLKHRKRKDNKSEEHTEISKKSSLTKKISRFGFGVPEKCNSTLILGPCRGDQDYCCSRSNFNELIESGVTIWEGDGKGRCKSSKSRRHFRRYGLSAAAHFLYALGPWSIQPGERGVHQGRRSFSLVTIRRQPADPELKLPVSRRQLGASVSCTALEPGRFGAIGSSTRGRVVLFWTPDYWYRPRAAASAYRELRKHLNLLRNFRQEKERQVKRKIFSKRKKYSCEEKESYIVPEEKSSFLGRIFSGSGGHRKKKRGSENEEVAGTGRLKRLLRMDFRITIWDIDSTTLATQLTLIDLDLFTRIPAEEVQILVYQKTPRNAPNLGAWVAFGHRISCLTVSEILSIRKLEMRSRIIARFINAAHKCFVMGNFHSCRSILAGLQAPPIYRLRTSWSYLRIYHANRYEAMEKLCKIYKSPCTFAYRRAWMKAEKSPPYIPYVGDLLTRILGLNDPISLQETFNQFHKKQIPRDVKSTARSADINKENVQGKINQDSLEQKQGLGKRILAAALAKMRFKTNQKMIQETGENLSWTSRQQDLARKYFYRWNNFVLKSKISAMEEERLRNMDPRKKRVLDVASWLMDCQKYAQGYNFPGNSFAREFLLKARYREDRDNFFISLKLEPSKIT